MQQAMNYQRKQKGHMEAAVQLNIVGQNSLKSSQIQLISHCILIKQTVEAFMEVLDVLFLF